MIATPERRKHVRARRDVVCGRRNCGRCTRWRRINEYTVTRWADREKTTPRVFSSKCKSCARLYRNERRNSHPRPRPEIEVAFSRMTLQDRQEYSWEEGVPLARWSNKFADEDFDPTPVPQGCPKCYLKDNGVMCITCPERTIADSAVVGSHARVNAGRQAMHVRWHVNRGVVKPTCALCQALP